MENFSWGKGKYLVSGEGSTYVFWSKREAFKFGFALTRGGENNAVTVYLKERDGQGFFSGSATLLRCWRRNPDNGKFYRVEV